MAANIGTLTDTSGNALYPQTVGEAVYMGEDETLEDALDAKEPKAIIKTTLDSVLIPGAKYFLHTQSSVSFILPSTATAGQQISIVFYSSSTATTLTTTSAFLGDLPVPKGNHRYELNFEYDGTNWSLLSAEQAVS